MVAVRDQHGRRRRLDHRDRQAEPHLPGPARMAAPRRPAHGRIAAARQAGASVDELSDISRRELGRSLRSNGASNGQTIAGAMRHRHAWLGAGLTAASRIISGDADRHPTGNLLDRARCRPLHRCRDRRVRRDALRGDDLFAGCAGRISARSASSTRSCSRPCRSIWSRSCRPRSGSRAPTSQRLADGDYQGFSDSITAARRTPYFIQVDPQSLSPVRRKRPDPAALQAPVRARRSVRARSGRRPATT